ncbi:hypothetical protein [Flavisolibacter nicotianae]|uniref:hypothetical protein n=1 Tax=Flavisolibacter nicotianae TaxID=2364882 RepID=UPI000EB3BDAD|nr:hypothetical protein [Flavisolibacter nicotianae]
MRTLLLFTGSLIYPVVMFIISPLLLLVYSGLFTARLYIQVKKYRPALRKTIRNFAYPQFHLPMKKQANALWSRAIRFHL